MRRTGFEANIVNAAIRKNRSIVTQEFGTFQTRSVAPLRHSRHLEQLHLLLELYPLQFQQPAFDR
jgi:hypothetical protein